MNLLSVRRPLARVRRAVRFEVHAFWRSRPIRARTVLYESFAGNGMLDNPEAIFRSLLSAEDMTDLTHIWVLSSFRQYRSTIREFSGSRSVQFVKRGSIGYYRALATSQFLVNNSTFPSDFGKRTGQIYLNTWHGTPLKQMGFDMPNGGHESANTLRNFLAADFLLSANPFMSEQMYEKSYKLRGIYRGQIIEAGYPRIDRQFLNATERERIRKQLMNAKLPIGDRRVILYAPTWKGTTFSRPIDDVDALLEQVAALESQLDTEKYCVLLKTHQAVHTIASSRPELSRMLVPNEIPTNAILGVTDILVTDYSSIFFDYLASEKPVVFFAPDLDDYANSRGFYLNPENWPGPVCRTVQELASTIRTVAELGIPESIRPRYESARASYCSEEDGAASGRVINIVFRGYRDDYRIHTDFIDGRKKVLVYLGGMKANGITSSALNLLNRIDYSRFDVTVYSASASPSDKHQQINPSARQLLRVGGMNGSKFVQLFRRIDLLRGRMNHYLTGRLQAQLWQDEWTRCFGPSHFDHVVDFSGYSPFWACLLQQSPSPAWRSIWLHNDLAADAKRSVNGRKPFLRGLRSMVALYEEFDSLVSVSKSLADVNRRNLASKTTGDRFTAAENIIDAEYVRSQAQCDLRSGVDLVGAPWMENLYRDDGTTTFITVGRLSEEKNHARLIAAFAPVHAANPRTRLMIVGGGPLGNTLRSFVHQLKLDDAVILTGEQANPYPIMARADCFVLSSNYEGQPMVILEALILGLPVVTVAFASVADALPAGGGLIVPQSAEGLTEGMNAYLSGQVQNNPFDDEAYNTKALKDFYAAIGVREA